MIVVLSFVKEEVALEPALEPKHDLETSSAVSMAEELEITTRRCDDWRFHGIKGEDLNGVRAYIWKINVDRIVIGFGIIPCAYMSLFCGWLGNGGGNFQTKQEMAYVQVN